MSEAGSAAAPTALPQDAAEPGMRVGFLVLRRQRPGFDPEWGERMEKAAKGALRGMGHEPVEPSEPVTEEGAMRRALAEFTAAGCDLLVVTQPTMGDGRMTPTLAQQWDGALVLWATPERPDGEKVSACSLVGTHAVGSLLRQMGRRFELASGHPEAAETREALGRAMRVAWAGHRLSRARIALVGDHAPGFLNMAADPTEMARLLGAQMQRLPLPDFMDAVEGQDDEAVARDVEAARALGLPAEEAGEAELPLNSRYYLAMGAMLNQKDFDAIAVRCWPELPNRLGQWPYLAMARLTEAGRVVALEGDADGALTGLMGKLLGMGPGYISDWLEHDERRITLWHPGHAPFSLCEPIGSEHGPRLGVHFNNRRPTVVNARLAADQPITIARLWRCDGRYRLTAFEGETRRPERMLYGAHGVAETADGIDANETFEHLCHAGMPHHVTVWPGHHAGLLRRFARHFRLDWVSPRG